jgi:hypothetical protein
LFLFLLRSTATSNPKHNNNASGTPTSIPILAPLDSPGLAAPVGVEVLRLVLEPELMMREPVIETPESDFDRVLLLDVGYRVNMGIFGPERPAWDRSKIPNANAVPEVIVPVAGSTV